MVDHISARPAGYFHAIGDTEKTASARRATFNPAPQDRISNRFARQGWPRAARFANSIREFDLKQRQKINTRRLDSARARFDALAQTGELGEQDLRAARAPVERLEFKEHRLGVKQSLVQAARVGTLKEGAQEATEALRDKLLDQEYVPLSGLGAMRPRKRESEYLVSAEDGHRIKINSEAPPRLARMVAASVSAGFDEGRSGVRRAMHSTWQHALVGVYSAEQSIKGMAARRLAQSTHLDEGARQRMDVRAARAQQKRGMAQASLRGNVALGAAFDGAVRTQLEAAAARLADENGPDYDVQLAKGGVAPPQTRWWQRRANAYYEQPGHKAGRIARFAVGVANLHDKAGHAVHAWRATENRTGERHSSGAAEQSRHAGRALYHEMAAAKAAEGVAARRAILQGQLFGSAGQAAEAPSDQAGSLHHEPRADGHDDLRSDDSRR